METTEHITESYIRYVKKWYTNSNIKCKGGKEIDIIAIDKNGKKYHIECGVTHKKHWALKSRVEKGDIEINGNRRKWKHRNSVDFFLKEKFNDNRVKEVLKDHGFKENYKKIIVVWDVKSSDVFDYAKKKDIEIWCLKEKIIELLSSLGETYYEDDINRTLQLVGKALKERINILHKELPKLISNKKELKCVKERIKKLI